MSSRVLALVVAVAFATIACGGSAAATSGPTTGPTPGPTYAEDNSTPAPAPASDAPSQEPATTPAGNPGGAVASVAIVDNDFSPADLTIAVGTTVTWTNTGQRRHTVTSTDGGFTSSGTLSSGDTYAQTFGTAATFAYICAIHTSMKGTITVTP
jgi:plastocyanin